MCSLRVWSRLFLGGGLFLLAVFLSLAGVAVASAQSPPSIGLAPYVVDVWPRSDGGADGTLTMTWHAAPDETLPEVYKYLGHGSEIAAVTDQDGRPVRFSTAQNQHELGTTIFFDPPIPPGQTRTVVLHFYQDHVWHYDAGGQEILLDVPWVGYWNADVDIANETLRVHVPKEIASPPIAAGWTVDGQTLIETRKAGGASLSINFYAPRAAEAHWTAPLIDRVPVASALFGLQLPTVSGASGPLGIALLIALALGGLALILGTDNDLFPLHQSIEERAGGRVADDVADLHPAAIAALVSDHDEALIAEACLVTLVDKGAIRLVGDSDRDCLDAVDLACTDRLGDDERGWYDALFSGVSRSPGADRVADVASFLRAGGHRTWRNDVDRQLAKSHLLQSARAPGLDGLSYLGWATRESWRRRISRFATRPAVAMPLGLAGFAVGLILAGHALASIDGYVEMQSQQFLIAGMPVDGMPVVELYNTIDRFIPLPPSHSHDFNTTCNGTCGSGRFLGEHSCSESGGGPGSGA